jgi:hypothetical protein
MISTMSVADGGLRISYAPIMLRKNEILDALRAKIDAGLIKQADVGRALGLPSSRTAELFGNKRGLSLDEACTLVEKFRLQPPMVMLPSEEVLTEMLRGAQSELPAGLPYAEWPRAVASALRTRLQLLAGDLASNATEDDASRLAPGEGAQLPAATRRDGVQ